MASANRAERRAILAQARQADPWDWEDRSNRASEHPDIGWGRCVGCHVTPQYAVLVYDVLTDWGPVMHLAVRRHTAKADIPWADKQRIKDHVAGPERVAVEVFPPRSELVDAANMYHLWVMPEGFTLPWGLKRRWIK